MSSDFKNYRRYPRFSVLAKAVITRQEEGSPERLTATVNTISQGGMGFYTDVFFEKTEPVCVELLLGPSDTAGLMEGRIASVCSLGKDYFVGIAFEKEIPYERFAEIVN